MQCFEISIELVSKMKSIGPPASLHESPWYNNYAYGPEEKKIEGRRGVKHMKKLRRGGFSLSHRTKGKGRGEEMGALNIPALFKTRSNEIPTNL